MARPSVVLPDPDSPTTPTSGPRARPCEMPSTALTCADRPAQQPLPDREMHAHVVDAHHRLGGEIERRRRALRLGRKQHLGVGMPRVGEHLGRRARLDDQPVLHHGDIVGEAAHDAEIMRDEQHRHAVPGLQVLEQREDLRLHRDIEGGGRLVGDEQVGPVGERHGDHHALALAAGKLMRIGAEPLGGIADPALAEQIQRAGTSLGLSAHAMHGKDLADLPLDRVQRVERGHRLLEDHGDGRAAQRAQPRLARGQHVLAVEQDLAADPRCGREQARDGERGHRLARARFADQRQRAAFGELERDAVDGHRASRVRKGDAEIADVEERHVSHRGA